MNTPVWIGLGSNLGDRRAILDAAVAALIRTEGVTVTRVSTYRETTPIGGPPGQGPFLNAAARLDTTLAPRALLAATQRIEAELGRVRVVRWGERTLDIDLLIFGSKFVAEPDLKLPHPRLAVRRFVLEPLAEIAPDVVDTITRRTVADLLANLDRLPRSVMLHPSIMGLHRTLGVRLATELAGDLIPLGSIRPELLVGPSGQRIWSTYRNRLTAIETIRSALRDPPRPSDRWSVFEFAIDLEATRRSCSAPGIFELDEPTIARARQSTPKMWDATQVGRGLGGIDDPTLAVAATDSPWTRKAGIAHPPIYRPEATEIDAVAAEVAAVCRGIAGV